MTNRGKIEPLTQKKLEEVLNTKYGKDAITLYQVIIDGRGNRGQACRQGRIAASSSTLNNSSCPSDIMVAKVYVESETPSTSGTREHSSRYH